MKTKICAVCNKPIKTCYRSQKYHKECFWKIYHKPEKVKVCLECGEPIKTCYNSQKFHKECLKNIKRIHPKCRICFANFNSQKDLLAHLTEEHTEAGE